jgi:hypothetical protein
MRKVVALVHPQETINVSRQLLIQNSGLFTDDPVLTTSPYVVKSTVSLADFRTFVSALNGARVEITEANLRGLSELREEFCFRGLSGVESKFGERESERLTRRGRMEDSEARRRVSKLEERLWQREREIVTLELRMSRLETEVSGLRKAEAVPDGGKNSVGAIGRSEAGVKVSRLPVGFESKMISEFPEMFGEFWMRRFSLLWRGSRDGFGASDFHRRCDGHTNTLTMILDTDGNIFGGFTPVAWESAGGDTADPSEKSFIFTLKNRHNIPAQRFVLKAGRKYSAIVCLAARGPHFRDIVVFDKCNTNTDSYGYFDGSDDTYASNTRPGMKMFFASSMNFQVKEIEVFEITA